MRVLNWLSYMFSATVRGIRTRNLSVVYASSPHLLAGVSGYLVARLRRVPFILEIRDVWPRILVEMGTLSDQSLMHRGLRRLELFLYRRANHIVFMAEGVEAYLQSCGVPLNKMTFIPNGADPADFLPSASRADLRAKYGFVGVVAVYAGAHGPANGLDLLLDAAKALREIKDLTIVFIGDGVLKPNLVARATTEAINNVRFMDPIPKSEIPDLLNAVDIGVHCLADVPLFRDGVSPNKLFDYMAAGLPVLTNVPGICTSYVRQSNAGVGTDPEQVADGLRQLCHLTAAERRNLGQSGMKFLDSTRSRSAMAVRLQSVLEDVS